MSRDAPASIEAHESSVPSRLKVLAPALVAGLLLAFSRTLWSFATIAEVYTLNTLLIVVVFFLMFRWRRLREAQKQGFQIAIVPRENSPRKPLEGLQVIPVARVGEALEAAFSRSQ